MERRDDVLETTRGMRGIVTAPHHLAAAAGADVLKAGGTAVEAAVAMGAALAVVYPHMTHVGGDGFWLIAGPDGDPVGIDASGGAGAAVDDGLYAAKGLSAIPTRGPLAANTVPGTVAGWEAALRASAAWQPNLPLEALFEAAIWYAENGFQVTRTQAALTAEKKGELIPSRGFSDLFRPGGRDPAVGDVFRNPALGTTLRRLARTGLADFYRGTVAADLAADLAAAGSPVTAADLAAYAPRVVTPLTARIRGARLFNMTPPTQGVASLLILALFDRLGVAEAEGFEHLHGLVEATKQAFLLRDAHVGCPTAMTVTGESLLEEAVIEQAAAAIDMTRALPWPRPSVPGDTIWCGAIDGAGRSASFIQSIFFEFGSGVVSPATGVLMQNRGSSFQLSGDGPRRLKPGRKPFHTLNPAMAIFDDGRRMVYGTMGGEGQPQTQAAIFSRYAMFGQDLQAAVTAPRWLLGKTWGEGTVGLKLEDRFPVQLLDRLRAAGHSVEVMAPYTSTMGHAGALVRHTDGRLEGATDPRSDGAVGAY